MLVWPSLAMDSWRPATIVPTVATDCNRAAMLMNAQLIQALEDAFAAILGNGFVATRGNVDPCGDSKVNWGICSRLNHLSALQDRLTCGRSKPHTPLLLPSLVMYLW